MLDWIWDVQHEYPDGHILVSTHGQAIRSAIGRLLGWSHFETTRDQTKTTPNVSITHISTHGNDTTIHCIGKEIIHSIDNQV